MANPDLIDRIARIVNPTAWDDRHWGKPAGFKSDDRDQQRYAKDHARMKAKEIVAAVDDAQAKGRADE